MKVILLKDVQKLGKKFDVKEVSQGYGMNFLVKRGFAKVATKDEESKSEMMKREVEVREKVRGELINKTLERIDGREISIKRKANEKGHLFSALNKKDIAEAMGKQLDIEIDEKWIDFPNPIKEVSKFSIPVKKDDMKAIVILNVEGE